MPRKKKSRKKTVGFLGDFHSPYHNTEAIEIACDYMLSYRIDTIILTELPDFYQVSSWKKDPLRMPFDEELELDKKLVKKLTKRFKKQEKIYIPGNHDERLIHYVWNKAPQITGLTKDIISKVLGFQENDWLYQDNKKAMSEGKGPLSIGKLVYLHGHEVKTGWGAVNLAKIYYERCKTNVIFAHHHRWQELCGRTIRGEHEGAWGVGCMCDLYAEYMPHNDWIHGFALIDYDEDGFFSVANKKIIHGRVV